jgi:hypothetical protein
MVGTQATRDRYRALIAEPGVPFFRRTPQERVLYLVHFSFDLIEAGGLHALFFCDWHGVNDYRALVGAYRAIGARQATEVLARIGEIFPEGRPPANCQRRRLLLEGIHFRRGRCSHTGRLERRFLSEAERVSRCLERAI